MGYLSEDDNDYKKYWPADVHLVGKEIVRFHTIIWPAMLMALGEPLPKQVFGHGWLLLEGGKMSKSRGNVIDPVILVDKYGVDAIRYFLLREVPFGADGMFSNEALINRINSDLANDLGNLINRAITMINKYFEGVLPVEREQGEHDESLKETAVSTVGKVEELMDKLQFSNALVEIWKLVARTNKYIDETMPWVLAKDDEKKYRLATVLYNLSESIRIISILIKPFMPDTSAEILRQMGIESEQETDWDSTKRWGVLKLDLKVNEAKVIFPRIDIEKELQELEKLQQKGTEKNTQNTEKVKDSKECIDIEDFAKLDLRVAKVKNAEKIEGADKLLKLQLEVGDETRQVVSGIAEHYSPEQLIGKDVVYIANLKPIKLRGIESQGMILAASNDEKLVLLTVDNEINSGTFIS